MNKTAWALGTIMFILVLIIFFILGLSVGAGSQGSFTFTTDTISAWVAALATVTIAVLTIFLAKETWALRLMQLSQIEQIRKDSIKPSVNLFLKNAPIAFNFIDVHIVNNGMGVAQNIKFTFINKNNETQDVFDYLQEEYNKLTILKNGISSLGANENRLSYLFSFIELHKKFKEKALEYIAEVDIEFEDIEGQKYYSKSFLNFTEYKGVTELGGGDPIYKISTSLDKIQKDISHFASGHKKIKADVYTKEDRDKKREERDKKMDEIRQRQNESS